MDNGIIYLCNKYNNHLSFEYYISSNYRVFTLHSLGQPKVLPGQLWGWPSSGCSQKHRRGRCTESPFHHLGLPNLMPTQCCCREDLWGQLGHKQISRSIREIPNHAITTLLSAT